jgi:methionyl-tRNA formyltransferase
MRLGVLASGLLGAEMLTHLHERYEICFVLSDRNSSGILSFTESMNIPVFKGNPRNGQSFEFIKDKKIEALVSINYLYLIEEDLISLPSKCAFNVHGSLLPKYRGRSPHVWAIINNEIETGVTAHLITTTCDAGDILEQIPIPIEYDDTGYSILEKYKSVYPLILESVLSKLVENNIVTTPQDNTQYTYFGKRTPCDGEINWNWQKERIRNWIRAQSYPYPGAFTFNNNVKITIDEAHFSNHGYSFDLKNGMILSIHPLLVKTPNGVMHITKTREKNITLNLGDILGSTYEDRII